MRTLARLVALLALLIPTAYAAETGYTLKATELKDKPFLDADTVATLPEKTTVEIVMRQGAWMQIKAADARQGWIRMLSVRLGSPDQKPQSGGNLLSALGIGNRPRPATTSTVTTGVRGFSEEDLAKAKPNAAEVEKMKSFAATTAEAAKLAESGKLATRPVAYFDERGKPLKEKK
ncbi:MAG: SH3 domain-containing protein [Betaproteobacteria bacterium]|nr:SH3 domain-containing protein [Betaproteobacteria bacterium]